MREPLKEARQSAWLLKGVAAPTQGYLSISAAKHLDTLTSVVILPEGNSINQSMEDLKFFNSQSSPEFIVLPFPEFNSENSANIEPMLDRLSTLTQLANAKVTDRYLLVSSLKAITAPTPAKEALLRSELRLYSGISYSFTGLVKQLNELGYDHESEVESPGQFAVRGGIIDLYPTNALLPYRLDFFGDEIEDIRSFEPDTQRSTLKVDSLIVAAPPGKELKQSKSGILEYLPKSTLWQIWEPGLVETNAPEFFSYRSSQTRVARVSCFAEPLCGSD